MVTSDKQQQTATNNIDIQKPQAVSFAATTTPGM